MANILLIEDETRLRENIAELLEFFNHKVTTAIDGLDGLNKLIEFSPDMILCDIMMPRLNGLDFLVKVKETSFSSIPVILLSAKVDANEIKHAISLGAQDYIKKPFLISELLNKINYLLSEDEK